MARSRKPKSPMLLGAALGATSIMALSLAGWILTSAPVAAQDDRRVALAQQLRDAVNRGDVDATMALFTDTALAVFGRCPLAAPCTGDAIRQGFEGAVGVNRQLTHFGTEVLGGTVVIRVEARGDDFRAAGVERILVTVVYQIAGDKIAALVVFPDLADAETARWIASLAPPPQR